MKAGRSGKKAPTAITPLFEIRPFVKITNLIYNMLIKIVAIDFPGKKRRRNIKMRAQLMIFMWRGIMTETKHKVYKTTLLTFRCGRATYSE